MPATQTPSHRTARKTHNSRPVQELLLELAYRLHATRPVKQPTAGVRS